MTKELSHTNGFAYLRSKVDWGEQELTIAEIFIVGGLLLLQQEVKLPS